MKRALLIILLGTCVSQLKAQISLTPFFSNKITWRPTLKPKATNDLFTHTTVVPQVSTPLLNNLEDGIKRVPDARSMRYLMPIAKVSNNDKMPIVKTDEPGIHYTMLIKGYGSARLDSLANSTP
ncbi:hypothetical protein [Mucilaginibacter sp. FT3.2]|uniref:hypothetical protein n=1 Tax=Mucilaginibacter sp. FT3.2 TaxID=2723090 RepID=UPI00161987B2|nr:hypothetical protein [Mucilaginibacter sp. FT3.2]MBB6232224.1 hypothetical protein [Mucilaginibacter sp. FT3.2]